MDGTNILYGLSAIKSIGKPVISGLVEERKARHQMERKYCPDITIHYEKETEEER